MQLYKEAGITVYLENDKNLRFRFRETNNT